MRVLVKKIRYVKGIPEELTEKAVAAGELRRGSVVGLDVSFVDFGKDCLIELLIRREGEERLVAAGASLLVDDVGSIYYLVDGGDGVAGVSEGFVGERSLPERRNSIRDAPIPAARIQAGGRPESIGSCC